MMCRLPACAKAGLLVVLLLSLPAASQAEKEQQGEEDSDCSAAGENCIATGCCQNSSLTCFAKTDDFAACLEDCTKGIHEDDPEEFQIWWVCSTPDLWQCSQENENCANTGCCWNPDQKCYKKNGNFSSCKESCEPGVHEDDDKDFQTPWDCSEVTSVCAEVYEQCGGKGFTGPTCCKEGCTCERTSAFYHQCARTDVAVGDNDGSANTCSGAPAPPPPTREKTRAKATKKPKMAKKAKTAKKAKPAKKAKKSSRPARSRRDDEDFDDVDEDLHVVDDSFEEEEDEDDDWDDDFDDVDYVERLPRGAAAAAPAARRVGSGACAVATGLVAALASAALVLRGRRRSTFSAHEMMHEYGDEPLSTETE